MSNWSDFFPAADAALTGVPYASDVPVSISAIDSFGAATVYAAGVDNLIPFTVRADVTIDAVWWHRNNTTAANVYVGIYDAAGNLLTDCAVDANTTAGVHSVATTPVTLTAGNVYYLALNESAQVVTCQDANVAGPSHPLWMALALPVYDWRMPSSLGNPTGSFRKSRTAAALPSTQTMTGWTTDPARHLGGFVPQ